MREWLRELLREPAVAPFCADSVEWTVAQRELLRRKPLVKRVYERWYRGCRALDEMHFGATPGLRWEIGSGAGFIADLYPDVVCSDAKSLPFIHVVAAADALPVRSETLRTVYALNVFHHLPSPRSFFTEMRRVLKPGGGLILVEPSYGPLARLVFPNLHATEAFEPGALAWEGAAGAGLLSRANQALSYIVFVRDRALFDREFPDFEILEDRPHTHITHLASGGLNYRALAPAWAGILLEGLEAVLEPLAPLLGLQHTIVLRRRRGA